MSTPDIAQLITLIAVAVLVLPAALRLNRRPGATLRFVAVWLAIAAVLALLYRLLS